MNKMLEFLQENNGGFSATRLGFLLWVIGVLVVWMINSLKEKGLAPIDSSVTAVIGILMTGKVVQKFGEKDNGGPAAPAAPKPAAPGQP
jgi:hypothetical protein